MSKKCGICEWSFAVTGPSAIEYAGVIGFDGIQIGDLGGARNCFPLNDPHIQQTYFSRCYPLTVHRVVCADRQKPLAAVVAEPRDIAHCHAAVQIHIQKADQVLKGHPLCHNRLPRLLVPLYYKGNAHRKVESALVYVRKILFVLGLHIDLPEGFLHASNAAAYASGLREGSSSK